MDAIRIVIADDQAITRSGPRTLLASAENVEIVGEARTGEEAVDLATALQPDVVLMDLRMPDLKALRRPAASIAAAHTSAFWC
jgi:DNA-binding NarL/FixJ family response regulator